MNIFDDREWNEFYLVNEVKFGVGSSTSNCSCKTNIETKVL